MGLGFRPKIGFLQNKIIKNQVPGLFQGKICRETFDGKFHGKPCNMSLKPVHCHNLSTSFVDIGELVPSWTATTLHRQATGHLAPALMGLVPYEGMVMGNIRNKYTCD
jgi:hypothetical protein